MSLSPLQSQRLQALTGPPKTARGVRFRGLAADLRNCMRSVGRRVAGFVWRRVQEKHVQVGGERNKREKGIPADGAGRDAGVWM